MQVTSKTLPKTQVELTVELSVEEVQPYVQKAAQRISKEVSIQGFRKGKVPYDILKQHVGEATIYEEAFNDIVDATYVKAIEQEKLQVAGRAKIDVEKVAPGNPVIYKVTVPLLPKITLGEYQKGLKAKKEVVKLDEKKFDTLKKLRSDLRSAYNVATTGRDLKSNLDLQEGKMDVDLTQEADLPFKLETNTQANARVQTQNFINEAVEAARETAYTQQEERDKHTIDFDLDANIRPKVTLNIESNDQADARVASYSQQVNTPQDIHDFVKMAMQGGKRA
jgi:hypothetical protein